MASSSHQTPATDKSPKFKAKVQDTILPIGWLGLIQQDGEVWYYDIKHHQYHHNNQLPSNPQRFLTGPEEFAEVFGGQKRQSRSVWRPEVSPEEERRLNALMPQNPQSYNRFAELERATSTVFPPTPISTRQNSPTLLSPFVTPEPRSPKDPGYSEDATDGSETSWVSIQTPGTSPEDEELQAAARTLAERLQAEAEGFQIQLEWLELINSFNEMAS